MTYKIGDHVRTEDKLHGHDSRIIHGVIVAIDTTEVGTADDPMYRIDWVGGGYDWLCAYDLEPDYEEVYLAEVRWNISTHNCTSRGNVIVGLYRSVNATKIINEMVARVVDITGVNIDRSRIHSRTIHDGSLEITYSVGSCNIIGFVSKMPIKED